MDAIYLLELLSKAETLLSTIKPGDQAYEMGRAEACIQIAIMHMKCHLKEAA